MVPIIFLQIREGVFVAGQDEERKAENASQETYSASDIRRSAQGQDRTAATLNCDIATMADV